MDCPTHICVHLSSLEPGEIPNIREMEKNPGTLVMSFGNVSIFLRDDQVNELAAKLMVHLPSDEVAA